MMWNNRNSHTQLLEVEIGTAMLETKDQLELSIHMPYDPGITCLGIIYPTEIYSPKHECQNIHYS